MTKQLQRKRTRAGNAPAGELARDGAPTLPPASTQAASRLGAPPCARLGRLRAWRWALAGACAALFTLAAHLASAQVDTNDFLAAARNISGINGSLTDNSVGATTELGEPAHLGTGGASVWYRWTATNSGVVTFDTVGSSFDTVLVAYRGSNFNTLVKITGNDDIDTVSTNSRISFATIVGTRYLIVVDGVQGAVGDIVLHWQPGNVPAPSFLQPSAFTFSETDYTVTEFEGGGGPFGPGGLSNQRRSAGPAVITVTRTGSLEGRAFVDFAITDGTAVANTDYSDASQSLVFDHLQATRKVFVPVFSDQTSNGTKTASLTLSNPRLDPAEDSSLPAPVLGFVSAANLHILELFNFDVGVTNFNIEQATYALQEDEGTVNVQVILTQPLGVPSQVTVQVRAPGFGFGAMAGSDYAISSSQTFNNPPYTDGTANIVDGADFVATNVTLTFPPGTQRQMVSVAVNDDTQVEFCEDIHVVLQAVGGSPGLGPNAEARVTIMDNESPAGAVDPEWNPDFVLSTTPRLNATPGANNMVRALAIQSDQKTIIGGDFTAYNSTPRNRLARINADGSNDDTFSVGTGADDFVTSLAIYPSTANSGKIMLGGGFTSINNIQRNGVARLNANGTLDATFAIGSGANGVVRSVAVQNDGKVLIAGEFTQFNGVNRNGVARLNVNGSLDLAFNPGSGADGTVWAVAVLNDQIFIGGEFLNFNGDYRGGVARLNADGSLDLTFDPGGGVDGAVYAVLPQSDGRLVIGGSFSTLDFQSRPNIARLETNGTPDLTFTPGTAANDAVYTLALQTDGKIMAGGVFTRFNGTQRLGLTRLFVNGTVDTSFLDTAYNGFAGLINTYRLTPPNFVNAIALETNGNVMIGGSFTNVGGHSSVQLDNGAYATGSYQQDFLGGAWSRQDKRPRYNVARLVGGYTPGPGNIELLSSTYTVDENAGALTAALRRRDGRLGEAIAQASIAENLAIAGVDFAYEKNFLNWPQSAFFAPDSVGYAGENYFTIPIANDSIIEGDELFNLAFLGPQGFITLGGHIFDGTTKPGEFIPLGIALGRDEAVATIVDNDFNAGTLVFSSPTYYTNEDAGSFRISVLRTNGSSGQITVRYFTSNGTAASGQDFGGVTLGTLTFGSGVTSQTITIPIVNDNLVEPDETFFITLTNVTGGATFPAGATSQRATAVIIDNDLLSGKANFRSAAYATNEDSGFALIAVQRLGGSVGELSVDVAAFPGAINPADPATDFTAFTNTITWVDGDVTPIIVQVPLTADTAVETNETVALQLLNPSVFGATGSLASATLTILNDDFYGALSFSQAFYDADERGTNITVTVVRTGGSGGTVSVNYTATDVTATNGVDYILAGGTLTFPPGVVATNFDIVILDNSRTDGERTATLRLSGFVNATSGPIRTATLRISDDESVGDPAGSLDTIYNPLAGGTNAIHSLVLQPDGKLLVGGEFRTLNRVLRNRIGRLNEDGSLDDTFDPKQGPNGAVRAIALQPDGRVVIGGFFTTVHSTNRNHIARLLADGTLDRFFNPGAGADNPVFALALDAGGRVIMGGSFATVNGISRPGIAVLDPSGTVSTSFDPGQGVNGTVFAAAVQPDGQILIGGDFTTYNGVSSPYLARVNPDGSLDATFSVGAGPDGPVRAIALQADGRILIGGAFTNYDGTARGRLARLLATGTLDTAFMTSAEGADDTVLAISLQFDNKVVVAGEFNTFNGVTRHRLTRLNRNGKTDPTINFGDGANDAINTITIQQDRKILIGGRFTTYDNNVRFFLARIYGGSIAGPGTIEFSSPIYSVDENAGPAVISVIRRGGTTSDITVDYFSGTGTATPGTDYTPVASTLTFPEGETHQTFPIVLVNDFTGEPNETVPLFLTNQTAGVALGAVPRSTLIIINDDSGVGFSSPSYTVSESALGGGVLISVVRTGATNGTASVDYRTVNGTARAGLDYQSRSGTLTFVPGETSQSFLVPIIDDAVIEPSETFQVLLTNLVGSTALSVPATTVTIVDNDFRTGNLTFSSPTYSVLESAGSVAVTILRTNGSTGVISVDYGVISDTALAGNDFVAQSGTINFAEGQTSATISIIILDDALVEGDEDFLVTLSNPTGGTAIVGPTNAVVTILDEEFGPGSVDRAFDPGSGTDGLVRSVAVQSTGKVLLGGVFTHFNGTNRNRVARLNPDGSLDLSFDPGSGADAFVSGVISGPNGKVIAGGAFDSIGGVPFNRLARFNDDGTPDTTFNRDTTLNAALNTVNVQTNGRVLIGGDFSLPTRAVGRLFADGSLDASFNVGAGVDGAVHSVVEAPDGSIVVGGAFTNVSGDLHERVAVLTALGLVDSSFVTGAITNGTVFAVAVQADGKILAGGDFATSAGTNRVRLARLNRDGSLDTNFNVGSGANGVVYAIGLQSSGQAIVAGDFTAINGTPRNRFARLNLDGTVDITFDPGRGADNTVFSLVVLPDDDIVIGGSFTLVGGLAREGVARIQGLDVGPSPIAFAGVSVEGSLLTLRTTVPAGQKCVLELSSDLRQWSPVATNAPGVGQFIVPIDPVIAARFFRVRGTNP